MDHFITVDPAMSLALLRGRKAQMRVLASSAIAACGPGDTIRVRESWIAGRTRDGQDYVTTARKAEFAILPDGWRQYRDGYGLAGKLPREDERTWQPALQMPRWAERMALRVLWIRRERLQQISRRDIREEGAQPLLGGLLWRWPQPVPGLHPTARRAFAAYWTANHPSPGERWEDDPDVAVIGLDVAALAR